MIERAVSFGSGHALVGVVNEPPGDLSSDVRPAVVFLNAGLLNRAGPHRMYVTLCRALAAEGFHCLRFDHGGLGDSDRRNDDLPYAAGVVEDAREAMDYLAETYGFESFVLGGLCSGADHSFLTACEDQRVVGGIFLDWYAYRTPGYYLRHYGPRMLRFGPWLRGVGRAFRRIRRPLKEAAQRQVDPYAREIPAAAEVEGRLQALLDREAQLLCVYTGGQDALFNHSTQFLKMFPGLNDGGRIRVRYLPWAEHTFPIVAHRQELVDLVLEWSRVFSGEPAAKEEPASFSPGG